MQSRILKLRKTFLSRGVDAFLVNSDVNICYLTGFPSHDSWFLITAKSCYYITDARYTLEAKKGLKGINVVEHSSSLIDETLALARQDKAKILGYDENSFTVAQFNVLQKKCFTLKLKAVNHVVESMRQIKDTDEVLKVRKALNLHKKTLVYLKSIIKPGITEDQVLLKLENYVKSHKAGFSFPSIIASGSNSCFPHAKVTSRKIKNNEPVLVDMGIDWEGYKSDLTRMFFLGRITQLIEDVTSYVSESQHRAIKKIAPGVPVAEVDRAARDFLKTKDLDKYFSHSLGHGVGLEIHESPRLSQKSKEILKEGMIVTVEPGVYLPNQFGIRIEDMVLVTRKGCEVLSGHIN